jgi:CTP synthase (UTP-ammonia lyase)
MAPALTIGLIGDFDPGKHSHWATEAALFHAAARLDRALDLRWVGSDAVHARGADACLRDVDGVWGAPGSPYVSFDGALAAIRFAREQGVPYLGTCAGFQYALIELSRSLLGLADADSAENDTGSRNVVITPVACALPRRRPGGPQLSGSDLVKPVAGTLLAELCGGEPLRGEYFCNFETNAAYLPRWQAVGLGVAGTDERAEMRAFALPGHPFFLATLFQPQLTSRPAAPHPIVLGFLRASGDQGLRSVSRSK